MEKLIRGEITESSIEEVKKLLPKKKLMIFVSSTFLDTSLERDILHRKILPDLQKKAQQHEIQVIFYDMRFGVKDENTLDHMTWETCKEAIRQCHEGSDGLFFLSLQADRYGYLPLPKYLDEEIIVKVQNDIFNDNEKNVNFPAIKAILDEWYILDENHCPPHYELKALPSLNDWEYWKTVLPPLRDSVFNSVHFEVLENIGEELRINHSVTEWETLFALNCDTERCYWVQRSFDIDTLHSLSNNSNCWKLTDIFEKHSPLVKLEALKMKMTGYLKKEQWVELTPQMSPEDYFKEKEEPCQNYLNEWDQIVRGLLNQELDKIIDKVKCWNAKKNIIPTHYQEEIIHHCFMAFTKAHSFYGRDDLLETAIKMTESRHSCGTESDNRNSRNSHESTVSNCDSESFSGIDLGLIGKSGCGKTSLMAKLALWTAEMNVRISTIIAPYSPTTIKEIQKVPIETKRNSWISWLTNSVHRNKTRTRLERSPKHLASLVTESIAALNKASALSFPVDTEGKDINKNGRTPTIIRFCGTSKFSLNGLKLIQSISIQLLAASSVTGL
jgi:hypothetical protein